MRFWRKRPEIYLVFALVVGFLIAFAGEYRQVVSEPITSWSEDVSADCGIVLTGGSNRVRQGIDMLSRGQIKKLIISGVYSNAQLREISPLWTFHGEIHEQDVVLDRRSTTTFGNAQQTLPIVEALGCRDIVLITSNLHMHRALLTFKAAYPAHLFLIPYAVNPGTAEANFIEVSTEVLKALFYGLWAY